MTWVVICALSLALLLQAMRSLSGIHLVLAGVLSLGLLWPVAKFALKAEVGHQVIHRVAEKVTESKETKEVQEPHEKKESLGCRMWNRVDGHKKNGLIRDHIRAACTKGEEQ